MAPNEYEIQAIRASRGAIQIVDFYHARQHLWELARTCSSDRFR
jgi:hypothetical protein